MNIKRKNTTNSTESKLYGRKNEMKLQLGGEQKKKERFNKISRSLEHDNTAYMDVWI